MFLWKKLRNMVCSYFSFKTFENVPWGQSVHIENIVKQYLDTMFQCLPTASRSAETFQLIETPNNFTTKNVNLFIVFKVVQTCKSYVSLLGSTSAYKIWDRYAIAVTH